MKFNFDSLAKQVLDALMEKGRVYLVGGIVRDMLLYHETDYHDVDVEIYDLEIDEVEKILQRFGKVDSVGKSFGVLKLDRLPNFDFALPRLEYKNGDHHRDFTVEIHKDLDLYVASSRRDFTINAMMYDYKNEEIIDLHHGMDDLNSHCLKMVNSQTFVEDPLRILRLAQFVARLEFGVDEKTRQCCKDMVAAGMLKDLSKERVMAEYNKLLMAPTPSLGLVFLREINALFEPLQQLQYCHQRRDYHPEGNVMNHTLLVVDLAAQYKNHTSWPLAFMWSALLHDIGKPAVTTPTGSAPGHNESGVVVFKQYFGSFFNHKKMKKYIETMIYYHMHLMNMARHQSSDYRFYCLLKAIDGIMPISDLVWISKCDKLGRSHYRIEPILQLDEFVADKVSRLGNQALKPLITGKDLINLGVQEGKDFKELLNWAYDLQMRGHSYQSIIELLKGKYHGR